MHDLDVMVNLEDWEEIENELSLNNGLGMISL